MVSNRMRSPPRTGPDESAPVGPGIFALVIPLDRRIREDGAMAKLSPELRTALDPMLDELRRGLRELDAAEVPVSLRRVLAATGRRLPPPLLASLVDELETNEWLRNRLAEELEPEKGSPIHGFLVREAGWWMPFADGAAAAAVAGMPSVDTTVVTKLERQLKEAKRRIADNRRTTAALEGDIRLLKQQKQDLEAAGAAAVQDEAESVALRKQLGKLTEELAAEVSLRTEAEERVAELKRRRPRPATSPEAERPPRRRRVAGALDDPVETGRRLDLQIATLAASRRPVAHRQVPPFPQNGGRPSRAAGNGERTSKALKLPGGIRPDSQAAINWVLALDQPVTVLVDGYNVTYLLDRATFATGPLRKRLVAELRKIRRQSGAMHRFAVVFDSQQAAPESEVREGGIEVRFTTGAMTADDEIVDLVTQLQGHPVVIFSNDRELRERAEARGALALWGTPLAARFGEA